MLNNLLTQLPTLMKDTEPDLKKLLGDQLKTMNIELPDAVIVKNVQINLNSTFVAGQALQNLQGQIVFNFKDDFSVELKGDQAVTLLIDKVVNLTISKDGLPAIQGISVDIPGPFNPGLKSVLIEGKELVVKAGPVTKRLPLPPEIANLM